MGTIKWVQQGTDTCAGWWRFWVNLVKKIFGYFFHKYGR